MSKAKKNNFQGIGDLFADYEVVQNKYISQEFQDFGYQLAVKLNDLRHKSLYIKMAKEIDRSILENALSFVADADSAKSKARLFMWKVEQLRQKK